MSIVVIVTFKASDGNYDDLKGMIQILLPPNGVARIVIRRHWWRFCANHHHPNNLSIYS